MKLALFAEGVGPVEAMILDNAKMNGHEVSVFRPADSAWVTFAAGRAPDPELSKVVHTLNSVPAALTRKTLVDRALDRLGAEFVLGVGVEGAAYAAATSNVSSASVLYRGDLDYSSRRAEKTAAFALLNNNASLLFMDDEFEMDKALGKDSRLPHLLNPLPIIGNEPVLSRESGIRVGVLHASSLTPEYVETFVHNVQVMLGETRADVTAVPISSMYSRHEIRRKHSLLDNLHSRLGDFTHLVILGTCREAAPVLAAMRPDWDRIVVEGTVGLQQACQRLGFGALGRGIRLVEKLIETIDAVPSNSESVICEISAPTNRDYISEIVNRANLILPWDYEELSALESVEPLNIFYSVGAITDNSSGARPQRVRNTALQVMSQGPTIRMFGSGTNTSRRSRLIEEELAAGRQANVFYGENSTSPIVGEQALRGLVSTIQKFGQAGGKSTWFVRDLHWLESSVDAWDVDHRNELITNGSRELELVGSVVDNLAAPSSSAGEGFNQLLSENGFATRTWVSVSPGVATANVPQHAPDYADDGTTLLYAGGIGDVYGMHNYLQAISHLADEGYYLDFIVRATEADSLLEHLHEEGLHDESKVRIIHADLENYLPRTKVCVGTILLDSEYAKFAFPYKTVSMIERGFPILTYSDMGIAEFVEQEKVGVTCERSAEGIAAGVRKIEREMSSFDFVGAQERNSWAERLKAADRSHPVNV